MTPNDPKPGDKVRLFQSVGVGTTATKHGIVRATDGAYIYIVCRVGRHTVVIERYANEIEKIIAHGYIVPETEGERAYHQNLMAAKIVGDMRKVVERVVPFHHRGDDWNQRFLDWEKYLGELVSAGHVTVTPE